MNPPRVYVYKDGLARFATVPYEKPHERNLEDLCMHLTNVAINKYNKYYEQNKDKNNDDVGSKRSLTSVLDTIDLEKGSETVEEVQKKIYDIILKTLCLAQPMIKHYYNSCQPDDMENSLCFQILGFDVMIDH